MKLSVFGEKMRVLRIRNRENLSELAKGIGRSVSFLSAVETGAKSPPMELPLQIIKHYNLAYQEAFELMHTCLAQVCTMDANERPAEKYRAKAAWEIFADNAEPDELVKAEEFFSKRMLRAA